MKYCNIKYPLTRFPLTADGLFSVLALIFVFTFTAASNVAAQSGELGRISGRVSGAFDESYINNVRIEVQGAELRAVSDENGYFELRNVPAGQYRIKASYLGFQDVFQSVTVLSGQRAQVDFTLRYQSPDIAEDEVVSMEAFGVVASQEMEARALAMNEQRTSPNLKNVVAFDEYGYTTDGNLGEFLKHIPGVAIDFSASIPVGVSIRGLPSNQTSITSDGAALAGGGTVAASRATSLAFVSTDNISRIEVTKVPTPDKPATGLGGSVNIISNSAFSRKEPLFKYSLFSTFRGDYSYDLSKKSVGLPIEGMSDGVKASHILPSFNFTYLRPINEKLAVSVSGSRLMRYIHNDTYFPGWRSDNVQGNSRYRVVPQVATIRSGQVKVDYKLNDRHRVGLTYQLRKRQATQAVGDFRPLFGAGATGDENGTVGRSDGVGQVQMQTLFVQRNNENSTAALKYNFDGDVYDIDLGVSHSRSNADNYDEPNGYFGIVNANKPLLLLTGSGITSDINDASSHLPTVLTAVDRQGNPVDIGDGGLYSINSVRSTDLRLENTRKGVNLNISREFGAEGITDIKAGLAYSEEDQDVLNHGRTFTFRPGQSTAVREAGNYNLVNPDLFSQLPGIGGYDIRRIDPLLVYDLYESNPEYFVLNEPLQHRTRANAAKILNEKITAAYIRTDMKFINNRLNVVAGVRFEKTEVAGQGPLFDPSAQYQKNADGSLVLVNGSPVAITTDALERDRLIYKELENTETGKYDGLYPSLNASYFLTEHLVARLGYARTIGRPDLPFIMPGASISQNADADGIKTISVVNTGLEPWTANNYDFTVEAYELKGGVGSIGVFQKDITNFFGTVRREATPEDILRYGASPDEEYEIISQENTGDASIKGFELGYRQALTFLPDWARGLTAYVNYTELDLEGSTLTDFTGFNPRQFNWGVNLLRPRFSVKFDIATQGETRRAPTTPAGTFFWAGKKNRDTISAEYQVTKHITVFAQVLDLLNGGFIDVQKKYNPEGTTPEFARYQRLISTGTTVTFGIKGKF